jgi:hypothetical protein
MSRRATMWVIRHSKARLAARLVLLAMARRADKNGLVKWPGIPAMLRETGISKRQFLRVLKFLAISEEIKTTGSISPGRPHTYRIALFHSFQSTGDTMRPTGDRMRCLKTKKENTPQIAPRRSAKKRELWNVLHVGHGPRAS